MNFIHNHHYHVCVCVLGNKNCTWFCSVCSCLFSTSVPERRHRCEQCQCCWPSSTTNKRLPSQRRVDIFIFDNLGWWVSLTGCCYCCCCSICALSVSKPVLMLITQTKFAFGTRSNTGSWPLLLLLQSWKIHAANAILFRFVFNFH